MRDREVPGGFAARHPYGTVTLLALTVIVAYFAAGTTTTILHQSPLVLYGSANLVLAVIAAILLTVSCGWRACGFRGFSRPRSLWIFWLAAIPTLVNLTHGLAATDPGRVIAFLLLAVLVGFVEESFYRGLMLRPLAARGAWRAAVITALIFGLTHGMNALAGSNPGYVLL